MCLSSNGKLSQHAKKCSDENEGDNPDSFRTWVLQNCRPPSLPRIQILLILQSYHLYTAYNFFFTILFWHLTHTNFKCIRFKLPVFLHSLRNNPSFYRIIYNFFHIFTSYIYIYNKYSRVSIQMPKVNILKQFILKGKTSDKGTSQGTDWITSFSSTTKLWWWKQPPYKVYKDIKILILEKNVRIR